MAFESQLEAESEDFAGEEEAADIVPIVGSGYLGGGYDYFGGNPRGDSLSMIDEGFRQPIVKVIIINHVNSTYFLSERSK